MSAAKLKDGRDNLRGCDVLVRVAGNDWRRATVVTHLRDDKWLVAGYRLPKRYQIPFRGRRMTVREADMMFVTEPK